MDWKRERESPFGTKYNKSDFVIVPIDVE